MWTRGSPTTTDTPVVDVERLLTDYAWKEIAEPTCYQRMMKDQKYKLEVDWNFLDISHEVTSFDPSNVVHRNLCLFRTEFVNESNEAQNFTFKTERTTTSKCEVSLLYGLRRGKSVEFRISIPPVRRHVTLYTTYFNSLHCSVML
jgi:hypothetical protein